MVKLNKKLIKDYMNNTSSNATDETYSCDYINDCNTYSTSETLTGGYWIDGKPIYKKTYTGSTSTKTDHNITPNIVNELNIENVVDLKCVIKDNQSRRMVPYYYDAGSNVDYLGCWVEIDGRIHMRSGSSYPATPYTYYVTIYYTKNN